MIPMDFRNASLKLLQKIRVSPLRASLVLLGFFLIIFSIQANAFSFASVSASTNSITLQKGTELSFVLNVTVQSSENVSFSFEKESPSFISIDGELFSISSDHSFSRKIRIRASSDSPVGTYFAVIKMRALMNSTEYVFESPVQVEIMESSLVEYSTSDYTNESPFVSDISFSQKEITVNRDSSSQITFSFVNNGSSTDYDVSFLENPLFLDVRILNSAHSKVLPDQRVSTVVSFSSGVSVPFGEYPVSFIVRNKVTNESFFLGTVLVKVNKIENIELFLPNSSFLVYQNEPFLASLTIENTEWTDSDVFIQTGSPFVQVESKQLRISPKSTLTIPVTILPRDKTGTVSVSIHVVSPSISESVFFMVETLPEREVPLVSLIDQNIFITNNTPTDWENVFLQAKNIPFSIVVLLPPYPLSLASGGKMEIPVKVSDTNELVSFDVIVLDSKGNVLQVFPVTLNDDSSNKNVISGLVSLFFDPIIGGIIFVFILLLFSSRRFRRKIYKVVPKPSLVREKKVMDDKGVVELKPSVDEKEEKTIQKETK